MLSSYLGGECVWGWRGRRSPGWVDSSVWGVCVEARGGRPLPPQGHRGAAVGNRGAVRAADPRPDGSSRHVKPQPAQPVEGHGGHLHEAQWEPSGQPRLQSPTHRVLTVAFPLRLCHFLFTPLLSTATIFPFFESNDTSPTSSSSRLTFHPH